MSMDKYVSDRGIEEVLHFTTGNGFTGIMAQGSVMARSKLPKEKYLEHIYEYNCSNRERDKDYWGYVNLSITNVNRRLFGISQGNWHNTEQCWWCILSFSPLICSSDGVIFTTTNNMYSGVRRSKGIEGFEAMFAPNVTQYTSHIAQRNNGTPRNQPTCEQAEVLYPVELPLESLNYVYVSNQENAAKTDAILSVLPNKYDIQIVVKQDWFI